jgi:dTDP-4-dehydrorhamnose reductase
MSKVLVTGAAGVVGGYVADVFSDHDLVLTDVRGDYERLDIRDADACRTVIGGAAPDLVIHLAAATDVDRCEQDHDLAFGTNAIGTQNVALAARAAGALLVYTSTAGVFGGEKADAPYTEFDEPGPANVYGDSKLAGERIVQTLLDRFFICRAGWMVGGGPADKKFIGKLVEIIDSGTTTLRAVDDKYGTPTYARDLATGIRALAETEHYGLYHLVNAGGSCTRYDVAVALLELLGRTDLTVEPVSSAFFPLPAPRARSEAMINYKLQLLGLDRQRHWREALEFYVRNELGR